MEIACKNNHSVEATVKLVNGDVTVVTANNYENLAKKLDKLNWKHITSERREDVDHGTKSTGY